MYREFENGMLARFRAMQSKLAETEPEARLYALVDMGHMSDRERAFLCDGWDSQHRSLYAGSGLDHLEQTGPILFAMPDLQGDQTYTVSFMSGQANPLMIFWRVLHLAEMDAQLVSWVWTSCDIEPFVEHLQTLLHARLGPDDEEAWFFFYQPSYLRVLYHSLPDDTRRHVFGPCHAWWTLDAKKRLVELAGENCTIPRAWDVFPIPTETVTELQREVIPRQVLEWLACAGLRPLQKNRCRGIRRLRTALPSQLRYAPGIAADACRSERVETAADRPISCDRWRRMAGSVSD